MTKHPTVGDAAMKNNCIPQWAMRATCRDNAGDDAGDDAGW